MCQMSCFGVYILREIREQIIKTNWQKIIHIDLERYCLSVILVQMAFDSLYSLGHLQTLGPLTTVFSFQKYTSNYPDDIVFPEIFHVRC